jgi:hypothetical protein
MGVCVCGGNVFWGGIFCDEEGEDLFGIPIEEG